MSTSHATLRDSTGFPVSDDRRLRAVARAATTLSGAPLTMDAVARIAAEVADVPIGLVSLVDGEWDRFVGQYGLTGQLAAGRRIAADGSLCRHVLATGDTVLITDASTDPRSSDSPVVSGLGVRAYAGVPLRGQHQQVVGALCAVDERPRPWTREQVAALEAVAALVSLLPGDPGVSVEVTTGSLDPAGLVRALAQAFVAVDQDDSVLAWNAAATEMFGWSLDEALGKRLEDFLFPGRGVTGIRAALRALTDGLPSAGHRQLLRATTREGGQLPVEATLSVLAGRGAPLVCLTLVDVSGQVVAEADAMRHESFLHALLDGMNEAVFACDAQGKPIFSNARLRRLAGVPDGGTLDVDTMLRAFFTDPDGRTLAPGEYPSARALAGEQVHDVQLRLAQPGRPERTLLVNAERIRVGGITLGAVVVLHDITDLRRAQRFRECDLAVSRALVGAADTTEACRLVVEALTHCMDWPRAELWLVDPLADVLCLAAAATGDGPGPAGAEHGETPSRRLTRGEGLPGEVWAMAAPVWVSDLAAGTSVCTGPTPLPGLRTALAVPIRSADSVAGVLALYADTADEGREATTVHLTGIAAYLGQYLERRRTEELALELARTKDDFLALVGHELRTPLTSIATYTQLLADSPESWAGDGPQLLGVVRRNTESLTAIIDDLLDLAGLESGHLTLRPVDTDLAELVRDAVETIGPAARRRELTLTVELPGTLPLRGDRQRLRQMLDNLLSNAVKYNHEAGAVTVRAGERDGVVTLTVSDTGIGIPAAERTQLFQRFYRSTAARDSGVPGTGLGLVVTRAIVEQHGGRISVGDNAPGTTMTIRLPVVSEPRAAQEATFGP